MSMPVEPPKKDIQIVASAAIWRNLRDDPGFIELMRLARVANSLALAYHPLTAPLSDQSPRAHRERFAALLYAAAVLKEALHTAQSLGRWFRELPEYKSGLGDILGDPEVRILRSDFLDKVRDELAFHFDRDPIITGLAGVPDADVVVIGSYPESGPKFNETYFNLADDAVVGYLVAAENREAYLERLERFMTGVANLLVRFTMASHRLIAAYLLRMGCRRRLVDRPEESD